MVSNTQNSVTGKHLKRFEDIQNRYGRQVADKSQYEVKVLHKIDHIKSMPTLRRSVITKTRNSLKRSKTSWNHLMPPETTQYLAKTS